MVVAVTGRAGYTVDQEDEKVVAELVLMVLMVVMAMMVENGGDGNRGGGSVKQC